LPEVLLVGTTGQGKKKSESKKGVSSAPRRVQWRGNVCKLIVSVLMTQPPVDHRQIVEEQGMSIVNGQADVFLS
jgi:hypothetical protein